MNWISEWALPKIKTLFGGPREVPDNLWDKCPNCEQLIFHRDLERALHVCPHCGHHMRIGAKQRLDITLDPGWQRIELPRAPADPLRFRDQRRYADRLKDAQSRTGQEDAVVVAHGAIEGHRAVVRGLRVLLPRRLHGRGRGRGAGHAPRASPCCRTARCVVFTASGGARMQEGAISLMQMPRTVIAARMVKEAGLPLILVLCDPTTGGVTASFAMLGDIQIAEPGALIGFAGARVIEQTVREKLPEGFQRAEYLLEHGILDMVVKRDEMRATLARLIGLLRVPESGSEAFEQDTEAEAAAAPAPALLPPPAAAERAAPAE